MLSKKEATCQRAEKLKCPILEIGLIEEAWVEMDEHTAFVCVENPYGEDQKVEGGGRASWK